MASADLVIRPHELGQNEGRFHEALDPEAALMNRLVLALFEMRLLEETNSKADNTDQPFVDEELVSLTDVATSAFDSAGAPVQAFYMDLTKISAQMADQSQSHRSRTTNEVRRSGRATKGQYSKERDIDETPAKKKATAKGAKAKAAQEADEGEDGGGEIVRCVCGEYEEETDDPIDMICCDRCSAWQHNDCMGLPAGYKPKTYYCEQCRPQEHKDLLAAMERGERPWEGIPRKTEAATASKKKSKKNRKSGADEQAKPATPAAGTKRKADESAVVAETKGSKKARGTPVVEINGKGTASAAKKQAASAVGRNAKDLPRARQTPAGNLVRMFIDEAKPLVSSGHVATAGQEVDAFATVRAMDVEQAVYQGLSGGAGEPNEAYKAHIRALLMNLRKNRALMTRVLNQDVTPAELAAMSAEDLATEEQKQADAARQKAHDQQHIIAHNGDQEPRIRRTHKGDEYVDDSQTIPESAAEPAAEPAPKPKQEEAKAVPVTSPKAPSRRQPSVTIPKSGGPRRQSSANFDITNIWSNVQGSPASEQQLLGKGQQPVSPVREAAGPGTRPDHDIDELLKDEEVESPPYSPKDDSPGDGIVWRGVINGGSLGRFQAMAKYAVGATPDSETLQTTWSTILPGEIGIGGRIDPTKADDYLCGLEWSNSSDLLIVWLPEPESPVDHDEFNKFFRYFKSKNRFGVGQQNHFAPLKDIYFIPLDKGEEMPMFVKKLESSWPQLASERMLLVPLVTPITPREDWQNGAVANPPYLQHIPNNGQLPNYGSPPPPYVTGVQPSTHLPVSTPAHLPVSTPAHLPVSTPAHLPVSTPAHLPVSTPAVAIPTPIPQPANQPPAALAARRVLGPHAAKPAVQQLISSAPTAGDEEMKVVKECITQDERAAHDLGLLTKMLQDKHQRQQNGGHAIEGSAQAYHTPAPPPPRSFSAVINQDHLQINSLSVQFGKLLSPKLPQTPELRQQRLTQLHTLAWRLVRHDLSEDLIMRPAFEQYLGEEGKAMSDHDRQDHEQARNELLRLYAAFERLPLSDLTRLAVLRKQYAALMADLAEHMKTESGEDIPRLEAVMGRAESEELGRRYLKTMVMEPGLRIAGRRVWSDDGASVLMSIFRPVAGPDKAKQQWQLLAQVQKRLLSNIRGRDRFFRVSEEVQDALQTGKPVVALETTIYTHGYPYPQNLALSSRLESLVRVNGGVPATIGIIDGVAHVGMSVEQLIGLVSSAGSSDTWKLSRRDLGFIGGLSSTRRTLNGGTTVAATMLLAHRAGIKIFATGGLGGVHRGAESSMDISADLTELSRTPVAVISSGCKSFLDIGRTLEYLETQGVGVGTFADGREEEEVDFPAFWARDSGLKSPIVIKDEAEAAAVVYAQTMLGVDSGLLLANPVPVESEIPRGEIESVIASAVEEAKWNAIEGNAYTPYVLKRIRELTEGRTVTANTALVEANVIRGTKVAVELAKLEQEGGLSSTVTERKTEAATATRDTPIFVNEIGQQQHRLSTRECSAPIGQVDVLVAGSLASDTICDYTPLVAPAAGIGPALETSNPASISQSAGGVGRNVAIAAHLAGSKVALTSAVANDVAGLSLLDQLERSGLSTSMVRRLEPGTGARTAQYVAVNDAKKDLVVAMADMSILSAPELESQSYWENCIEASKPKWLVVDANWSPAIMATIVNAARSKNISVAFEPVSTAKAIRLFDKRNPTIRPPGTVPNHSINLATPNILELNAIHTAARDAGYFESAEWWQVIDALRLSSSGSQDKLNSLTQPDLLQQGIPQQCIRLLPLIPNLVAKLGAKGVLVTQLVRPGDSKLRDPNFAPYLLTCNLDDNAVVGGVYMRLLPPATKVPEDEILSVNGVGDTMLGVIVAGLVKSRDLHEVIHVAQEAAVLTLKSTEAVSPEVRTLQGKLA
ncbi:hypothetical protein DV737_g2435, partial [Chaetothyriales sp. CBS 132003]